MDNESSRFDNNAEFIFESQQTYIMVTVALSE